jgi:hypothetical protein
MQLLACSRRCSSSHDEECLWLKHILPWMRGWSCWSQLHLVAWQRTDHCC